MIISKNKIYPPNWEFLWLKRSSGVGFLYCYSLFSQKTVEQFSGKLLQDSSFLAPLPSLPACRQLASSQQEASLSADHHRWPPPTPHLPPLGLLPLCFSPEKPSRIKSSFIKPLTAHWWPTTRHCSVPLILFPVLDPVPGPLHPTLAHTCLQHNPGRWCTELKSKVPSLGAIT